MRTTKKEAFMNLAKWYFRAKKVANVINTALDVIDKVRSKK
jgi:hypothetical protein